MGRYKKPNWQERCLMVIENICANECIGPNRHKKERCFPCELYRIAHVGTAECGHKTWDAEVDRLWDAFKKEA